MFIFLSFFFFTAGSARCNSNCRMCTTIQWLNM